MKNLEAFIENLVIIDDLAENNVYGHYPFQMFVETKEGSNELNALALGGMVQAAYRRFLDYYIIGAKRIYLSLDFPPLLDIENDFVAVYSYEFGILMLIAIPYNIETGEVYPRIESADALDRIMEDLKKFLPKD